MVQPIASVATSLTLESASFIRDIRYAANQTALATTKMEQSVKKMQGGFASAATAVKRAFTGFAAAFAIQEIVAAGKAVADYSDTWQSAANKIAASGSIAGRNTASLSEITDIAIRSRSGLEVTADLYAKLLRSTKGLDVSLDDVALATETVNKAFKASGASVLEAENSVRQLAQALGSGILQGDELRSIRENAPLIANAIAKEFDTTVAGLKKLGSEGKLTSDRVFKAIIEGQGPISTAFARTSSTIAEASTNLGTTLTKVIGQFFQTSGAARTTVDSINSLASALDRLGTEANKLPAPLENVNRGIKGMAASLKPKEIIAFGDEFSDAGKNVQSFFNDLIDVDAAQSALKNRPAGTISAKDILGLGSIEPLGFDDFFNDASLEAASLRVAESFQPFKENLTQLDLQVTAFEKSVADTHLKLLKDVGTPYEQWQIKLQEVSKLYPDLADRTLAAARAESAYMEAIDGTKTSLGLILPPMAEFLAKKREIADSDLTPDQQEDATAIATLKLTNAKEQFLETLGKSLTIQEKEAMGLRDLEAANIAVKNTEELKTEAVRQYNDTVDQAKTDPSLSAAESANAQAIALEALNERLDDLGNSQTTASDITRVATDRAAEYAKTVVKQAESLGLINPALADYKQKLIEIQQSGASAEEQSIATADATRDYKSALEEYLGLDPTPMEVHEEAIRKIGTAAGETALQVRALAQEEAAAFERQIAFNESIGLGVTPLQEFDLAMLKVQASSAGTGQVFQATVGAYSGLTSSVLGLAGQVTGAFTGLFKDNKALAIANAVINTAEAVTKTLAQFGGTPWGFAAAAVAAAAGAAQIATIVSTQPGSSKAISKPSGKGVSASSKAGASSTSSSGGGKKTPQQTVNITVQGEGGFSASQVRELIGHINEAVGDGVHLRVR